METLQHFRELRRQGLLDRESYWDNIRIALSKASELIPLIGYSDSEIAVTSNGMVLKYPLSENLQLKFFIDPADTRSIGVSVISEGRYEPVLESCLIEIAKRSESFCDVGANAGFYSVAVAKSNTRCKVTAFECNPEIRSLFERNLALNKVETVTVSPFALSNTSGNAEFFVPVFTGSGGGSLQDLHPEEGSAKVFTVDLRTLDSQIDHSVELMKVDVEGSELTVLQGGINLIGDSKPTIFIELLRKWMKPFGTHPGEVGRLLSSLGYFIFELRETGVGLVSEISDSTSATNFVFVHPSRDNHYEVLKELCDDLKN